MSQQESDRKGEQVPTTESVLRFPKTSDEDGEEWPTYEEVEKAPVPRQIEDENAGHHRRRQGTAALVCKVDDRCNPPGKNAQGDCVSSGNGREQRHPDRDQNIDQGVRVIPLNQQMGCLSAQDLFGQGDLTEVLREIDEGCEWSKPERQTQQPERYEEDAAGL